MEYIRTDDRQIRADFARRLGVVVSQYKGTNISYDVKYDDTLCLCVLQALLTNCLELFNELISIETNIKINNLKYWGIESSEIIANGSNSSNILVNEFFKKIRNALCHPGKVNNNEHNENTGYTSCESDGKIIAYVFFHYHKPSNTLIRIELSVEKIHSLVIKLCEVLSKPLER